MKKLIFLCVIAFAVYALQGCSHSPKNNTPTADSLTKATDTVGKTTTSAPMTVNTDDAKFATTAAEGGMVEVALANLALKKTNNPKITAFANMMVTDHTKANNDLMGIAKTKNIVLPTVISSDDQKSMDSLTNKSAADFDKAYVAEMINGHEKALALFKGEAQNGTDPDLKAFAAKVAPTVQMHLNSINKIQAGMK